MNDSELDQILDQWVAPSAPASLRDLRGRLGEKPEMRMAPQRARWFAGLAHAGWKGLLAGAIAAGAMCLFVVAEAFPNSPGPGWASPAATYSAESEVYGFSASGSRRLEASLISWSYRGHEIVVSEDHPGNPVQDAVKNFHNGIHSLMLRFMPGLALPANEDGAWFTAYVDSGCRRPGGAIAGREKILNYDTAVVQYNNRDRSRTTLWMAPSLGCFPLKIDNEQRLADGGYRLVTERLTRKVTFRR
jgi:hypothetical protein